MRSDIKNAVRSEISSAPVSVKDEINNERQNVIFPCFEIHNEESTSSIELNEDHL